MGSEEAIGSSTSVDGGFPSKSDGVVLLCTGCVDGTVGSAGLEELSLGVDGAAVSSVNLLVSEEDVWESASWVLVGVGSRGFEDGAAGLDVGAEGRVGVASTCASWSAIGGLENQGVSK